MKTVRYNTFETNSSSTHSLVITSKSKQPEILLDGKGKYHIKFRDFEGDAEQITSLSDKIAFLLQLSMQCLGYYYYSDARPLTSSEIEEEYSDLTELTLFRGIECVLKEINPNCSGLVVDDFRGHIDHQTALHYFTGEDFLNENCISLKDYLQGNVTLVADHD